MDPLSDYLAEQGPKKKPPLTHDQLRAQGFATENLPDEIPDEAAAYLGQLGIAMPMSATRAARRFTDLPDSVKAQLASVQPMVDQLGPNYDYSRLAVLAGQGKDKIPPDIYARMMSVAAIGSARQVAGLNRATSEGISVGANEAGRWATMSGLTGLVPPITEDMTKGADLSPQGVAIAKTLGSLAGIAASGKLVVSALSHITMLPKLGPLILELPKRAQEIMLGVGAGAVLDAARPDGLPADPMAIDIAARLAHPIASTFGNSELAQRAALAISGGFTGGALGEILGPVLRGIGIGRATHLAEHQFDPEIMKAARLALTEAGVQVDLGESNLSVASKLNKNWDKVSQSERLAMLSGADETRTSYILNQLYSDPAFSGPPKLPDTQVVGLDGQPQRMYHGSLTLPEGGLKVYKSGAYSLFGPGIYTTDNPKIASGYAALGTAIEETPLGYGFTHIRYYPDTFIMGPTPKNLTRESFEAAHPEYKVVSATPKPGGQEVTYVDLVQPNIQPVYINLKNPLKADDPWDLTFKAKIRNTILNSSDPGKSLTVQELANSNSPNEFMYGSPGANSGNIINKVARESGFDGIIHQGGKLSGNEPHQVAVAFHDNQVIPAFVSDDAKYMAGVFRANPGGLSIARGVTDVRAAADLVKRMGLNVVTIKSGNDYLMMRPQVVLPEQPITAKVTKQLADFTDYVRAANRNKSTTRLSILPDGSVVRGDYNPIEISNRYGFKAPVVGGAPNADIAVREQLGLVDVQVGQGGSVQVNLPSRVTQRQSNLLGSMADRGIPEITINGAKIGTSRTLTNSFGMQVQDALGDLVPGASRPKITADVVKKVQQYQQTGVFEGQAAHLPDGYPVSIVRKVGDKVYYKDPITGTQHLIPQENLVILPTSLEGELQPSRQIFEAMDPAEQKAFATLRRGINEGFTKPITTFDQLAAFASSRGKNVAKLAKGQIRMWDPNTGESNTFSDVKAAITRVRASLGPLPDLTPPEIEELLGYKPNLGSIGNNGPPARFGEPVAITEDEFNQAASAKTLGMLPPGGMAQIYMPTKALMEHISQKYNLPVITKVWDNLQSATVHRNNFVQAWGYGNGPGLPEDVMPLMDIFKLAGNPGDAKQQAITAWLESESDPAARAIIAAGLKPNEIAAAQELRKWYGMGPENGLFKTLGVESDFLTNYAPHLRENAEGYGNDVSQIWRQTKGTPLPKAVDFFADYSRDGSLNLYEDRAFVAASQYLNAGARSRFLNGAMDDAKRLLRAIPDNAVKAPLANYIEALRGSEFAPQRAALDASFSGLLKHLGASDKAARDVAERLSLSLLGMSYAGTMAFRPGLAIRNAMQIFQTTWPLLGRFDDSFAEAIGRAMTVAGRDEAIRAGAIAVKQNAVFAGEEALGALPGWLQKMSETGLSLYDGADTFARSVSFHVGKLQAQRAIEEFGSSVASGGDREAAQQLLIKRSGAMVLDKPFVDEFLRRVATSPESATDFMGKQISDVTQFLYGRGNQPRWMRSVPGRFLGQFGTWPLWFIDYTRRSFTNMWRNGYQKEALQFLGKLALVDTAIYETGKAVGLDLRKWMAGNALFGTPPFGQPPAVNALYGIAQLSRGLSENVLGTYDSPANQQRMAEAVKTLQQTGLAYIPGSYAVRDIGRLMQATTPTEVVAASLAVRPSTDYTVEQRLGLLFDPGNLSTDIDLQNAGDPTPTATTLMMKGMQMAKEPAKIMLPPGGGPLPPQPQGQALPRDQKTTVRSRQLTLSPRNPMPGGQPAGRPPLEPSALPPSIRSGESKPVP